MIRKVTGALAIMLLVGLFILPASGQERSGSITGVVLDSTGAVLPGVAVTVTNKSTNRVFTTTTRGDGNYTAPELEPGRYSVRFEASGFSRFEVADVLLLVGRTLKIDANMQVGSLEQTIQVTEAAPLIDLGSTMIAHNVTSEELDRLPKGRSFQGLALFSTSVNTGVIESGFQVNGASGAENNYYIDGVSTASLIDGSARQEAVVEHLQEVQVKTAGLEAEYGGALGGVVSAITKSGGNDFHGEIHYYHWGSRLSAGPPQRLNLDPVDDETVRYVQDSKTGANNHDFGGSLGGPFIKNQLFFFTSFAPRWHRGSRDYLFGNGTDPGTIDRKSYNMSWFNKVSWDPTQRIRSNFTWLYTPSASTGAFYSYNGAASNVYTGSLANAQSWKNLGYFQPEQNYSGNLDFTVTNTSLLSIKGGRYYLNYKDTGVSADTEYRWITSSIGIPGVPAELQQPVGFATPTAAQVVYDTTTRTYAQADFSQFVRFGGSHNIKAGIGTQKNVNRVEDSWVGPGGRVMFYWGRSFGGDSGQYGYYRVYDAGTGGSSGAHITHLYVQDAWRIHPRLTLNLGLRTERETIPSFRRDVQDYAFRFNFGDKLSPRLGASYDVFGTGKVKVYGSWGRYFDWTKFDLARGTFGGDRWRDYYRSLDTLDVYNISLQNMPGRNLWSSEYRDWRLPGFEDLDPDVKPMSADLMSLGVEYEIRPQTVFSGRYIRNKLNRTIEDMGALDEAGNEVYRYGNPGEGAYKIAPVSGATCVIQTPSGACGFEMPKPKRIYDALELSLSRRFGGGWLANASYVYSKLWGNYAGLQSTDEVRPTGFGGFGGAQSFYGISARPGGNANRYYDLDEGMWDAHGNAGLYGRLPTDRPHVFKFYGSKLFNWGTEVGGFYRISSGTPVTTQVWTVNHMPVYVNGRGDLGRTPVFSQTDLVIAHEVKMGEVKKLRFEMNMFNLFNQKTAQFLVDRLNREMRGNSSAIDLYDVDLSKGFDYMSLLGQTDDGLPGALDPRFKMKDLFNLGFSGRFMVKFIF